MFLFLNAGFVNEELTFLEKIQGPPFTWFFHRDWEGKKMFG